MDFNDEQKKVYHKPALSEHGDLKEITRGSKCCPDDGDHVTGPYS